ncbi:hypothetical protein [Nocardia arthritidis]|uniref:hypothetical protein n=1 Tax=Nocardia arthritidis TaxID=228602 RepID=UPI0007A4E74E|nr:hypothetical protein [Nocardia arthritidis]
MPTEHQIKVSTGLTGWNTRQALANLSSHELIVTEARKGRYEITQRGRNTLATEESGSHQA